MEGPRLSNSTATVEQLNLVLVIFIREKKKTITVDRIYLLFKFEKSELKTTTVPNL